MKKAMWVAACALLLLSGAAMAQDYPTKPIRIIVPYPPGGVTDIATRLVAAKMTEAFGQPVVVENIQAAGGVVGTNRAARAPPDGYTLMAAFDSFATNPYLYKGVEHDPIKDFAPITLMVRSPQLLVVNPAAGVKTTAELVRLAREKGDRLAFATPGAGTSSRLSSELFKQVAGVDITLVTYKGGAPALNDLLGGQVSGMIVSMSLVLQHVQHGRLIALAVSTPKRIAQLPDVPTIAETFPGFDAQSWTGMVAPAGTPRPIIDKLNAAILKALAAPDVREKLVGQGVEVVGSTPEMFGEWVAREGNRWGAVIKRLKITVD
jgi:tripartite-type tricarboxylate transporter receptor subunit TctC